MLVFQELLDCLYKFLVFISRRPDYTQSIWMSNVENNSFIVNIIHHNMYILETCNFVISEVVSQTELYNKTI